MKVALLLLLAAAAVGHLLVVLVVCFGAAVGVDGNEPHLPRCRTFRGVFCL